MFERILEIKNVSNCAWVLPILADRSHQFNPGTADRFAGTALNPSFEAILAPLQYIDKHGAQVPAFEWKFLEESAPTPSSESIPDLNDHVVAEVETTEVLEVKEEAKDEFEEVAHTYESIRAMSTDDLKVLAETLNVKERARGKLEAGVLAVLNLTKGE